MTNDNSTKKRIRETALRLFHEKSFETVTLSEICQKSGINKHTFYYYFKSKDDLLEKFYEIPCRLSSSDVTDILSSESYAEQLWLLHKKFIDFVVSSGISIIRQLMIKNLTEDVGTFHLNPEQREFFHLEMNIITKGQASGQFLNKTDPKALLILLHQSIHSVALIWVIKKGCFDYVKTVRYLFENLLDLPPETRTVTDFPINGIW